jgi:hypothetical protein
MKCVQTILPLLEGFSMPCNNFLPPNIVKFANFHGTFTTTVANNIFTIIVIVAEFAGWIIFDI